ncbi:HNH endonuclease signature motif containing protein [Ornithinimicrobium murale]|uniref:HNH endonuclease signature motif containing protein n=1 Tax=Ornithinimicrobium murale TaxID=1050153 RepID=UPI000E0DE968|nr:HNH endonuclease signature motif containing protein [Ornithinimicrobium murale]
MDTRTLQELIRQSLAVPPSVRAWSWDPQTPSDGARETADAAGNRSGQPSAGPVSGELWRVSFKDLIPPGRDSTRVDPAHPTEAGPTRPRGAGAASGEADTPQAPGKADTPQATDEHDADPAADSTSIDPADRLRAALGDLGVQDFVVEALTDTALACAVVAATLPGQGSTDHDVAGSATSDTDSRTVQKEHGRHSDQEEHGRHSGQEEREERAQRLGVDRGDALLGAIATLTTTAGKLDSVLLSATSAVTADVGELLLSDKGFASPEELSKTQRELWRRRTKNLTRREISAATGWGEGETTDLVALANTPHSVLAHVHGSLRSGESTWRLARSYFRYTSALDVSDAAAIASGLFGNDPATSVTERLNSSGAFHGHPWWHKEYYRALNREVAQVKARDPEATKKTREDNVAGNDVHLNVDEHGTGCLMIGTTATQGAAMLDRITRAAKAARAAGDPRTQRQLRVAIATALLLHGTLDLPSLPDDPALITVEQSAELNKILYALPTAELNVVVPLTTLLGCTPDRIVPTDADGSPLPVAFAGESTPSAATGTSGCTCACTCGAAPPPDPGPTGQSCPDPGATGHDRPDPGATGQDRPDPERSGRAQRPTGEVGIAEVIGARSVFLTPDEARTLALTPGSTLYRLLTDPATGALIERSSRAYRFDGAMRAHIISADVFCRAPGCLRPASMAQIDHAQEHGTPGGHTCIGNGHPLDAPHHDLKTKKLWDAVLHANRDVTWTTLLGRIYTTKTHDYRQYTRLLTEATTAVNDATAKGMDPAEAIDRQIYQALTYRPSGGTLEAPDDVFDSDEEFTGWDHVTPTHTQPDGKRSYHPDPHTARAEHDRVHGSTRSTSDQGDGPEQAGGPAQPDGTAPADGAETPWDSTTDTDPPF